MAYLLDTNIFNQLLDERIFLEQLPSDEPWIATYLQMQEISNTKLQSRREALSGKFKEVNPEAVPVETSLWGVTPWSEGKFGGDSPLFRELLSELDAMNGSKRNNYADVLIAEVTIVNSHTLITADQDLADLVERRSGKLIRFSA